MALTFADFANPGLTWQTPEGAKKIGLLASKQTGNPYIYTPRIGGTVVQPAIGQVEGAATRKSGGGGQQGYTNDQAITEGLDVNKLRQQGLLIEGGGGGQDFNQQISDIYASGLQVLSEQEAQVRADYPEEQTLLESQVENEAKKYTGEQEQLLGDVGVQEDKYTNVIRTALEDALRAFNALQQQAKSRFGFGSSTGQAVGELASQEFFRQQGQIGQKQAEGTQEFIREKGRIKTYVRQKLDDLEVYKKDILFKLKQQFQEKINEIGMRKGDIEANKANDKRNVLQDVINQARSIADQDKQFRQQLGLAAISQMQEISGRVFTPKEIVAHMADFGINLGPGATTTSISPFQYNPNLRNQDDLRAAGLVNL